MSIYMYYNVSCYGYIIKNWGYIYVYFICKLDQSRSVYILMLKKKDDVFAGQCVNH